MTLLAALWLMLFGSPLPGSQPQPQTGGDGPAPTQQVAND